MMILFSCSKPSTENAPQVASAKTGTRIRARLASSRQVNPLPRRADNSADSARISSAEAVKTLPAPGRNFSKTKFCSRLDCRPHAFPSRRQDETIKFIVFQNLI